VRQLTFQRVIGSGAFGSVYLAELLGRRGFRRQVAVKVLNENHPDGDTFVARVRDEARLLGLLQNDHILKVLELVRVQGRDAVMMEYVEGVDLAALVSRVERPPPRALAELGATVAGALHAAHVARHPSTGDPLNVVHRDVKPANVMITASGGVRLLDFGVAQARFAARESRTGQFVLGTLNYMAPEYIITGEVSPAADVYGLALTLWEAATGEVFGQPKLKQDAHRPRVDERLATLQATHSELVPVMRAMLDWNPQARPNGATVERQLGAAADLLRGTGLRSWATTAVPRALEQVQRNATDAAGLVGQVVNIADEDAPNLGLLGVSASRPHLGGSANPVPDEATLLKVERPAFLDAGPPPPTRSVIPMSPPTGSPSPALRAAAPAYVPPPAPPAYAPPAASPAPHAAPAWSPPPGAGAPGANGATSGASLFGGPTRIPDGAGPGAPPPGGADRPRSHTASASAASFPESAPVRSRTFPPPGGAPPPAPAPPAPTPSARATPSAAVPSRASRADNPVAPPHSDVEPLIAQPAERRPAARKKATSNVGWVILQGLLAGGLVGFFLVVLAIVVFVLTRITR
jgi:serine/threonine-protein kinase